MTNFIQNIVFSTTFLQQLCAGFRKTVPPVGDAEGVQCSVHRPFKRMLEVSMITDKVQTSLYHM